MVNKSNRIKQILIELAMDDKLPMDMTQLDATIFDEVFVESDENPLYVELGKYLSNDGEDYDQIISDLRVARNVRPNDMVDELNDTISVWEKVEYCFTIKDFCNLINL